MAPKVLDQHAFKAREQDIIDATIMLIEQQGVENITMDKVVALVPYSKGTVYKHFLGKEDLFLAIGNQAIAILYDLFNRAANSDGCPRERMLLLNVSYLIYAILHPALFKSDLCSKSPNAYAKCSENRIQEKEQLDLKLMGLILSIMEDAQENHQFTCPSNMDMQQVCFAIWAPGYGTISLLSSEVEQCSGSSGLVVERELVNQSNLIFDGLKWQPFSDDKDYHQSLKLALQSVFPSELALMKSMGRELDF